MLVYVNFADESLVTELELVDKIDEDAEFQELLEYGWDTAVAFLDYSEEHPEVDDIDNFDDLPDDLRNDIYNEILEDYVTDNFGIFDIDLLTGQSRQIH